MIPKHIKYNSFLELSLQLTIFYQTRVSYFFINNHRTICYFYNSSTLINLTVTMNQRSVSANRKLKTDLHQDISFDKKIAKAMQQKKQTISKMFTPRPTTTLPTYRNTHNYSHVKQKTTSIIQSKQPKEIKLTLSAIQNYLNDYQKSAQNCIIHPNKRAAFENKQKRSDVYCHQCAIKMVKNNYKMIGINEQTSLFKCFINFQLQLVSEQEAKVEQLIKEYYNSIRNALQVCYREYIDNKSNLPNYAFFAQFQPSTTSITKLSQNLGKLQQVKFRLIQQCQKENKQNIAREVNKVRNSIQHRDEKGKTKAIEMKVDLNRSVQNNKSILYDERRSRQNSFCSKAERVQTKKIANLR